MIDDDIYVQVDDEPAPPPSYFLDHYGTCSLGAKCLCLKPEHGWYGRLCPQWRPNGWTTFEEMKR